MNGEQVPKQVLKLWKASWETYLKTIKAADEQGGRLLDLMLEQSDSLQESAKKLVKQWVENSREISKSYLDTIEQNVKKIEEMVEPPEKKP